MIARCVIRALERFYERHPQADEAVFVTAGRFQEAIARIADAQEPRRR